MRGTQREPGCAHVQRARQRPALWGSAHAAATTREEDAPTARAAAGTGTGRWGLWAVGLGTETSQRKSATIGQWEHCGSQYCTSPEEVGGPRPVGHPSGRRVDNGHGGLTDREDAGAEEQSSSHTLLVTSTRSRRRSERLHERRCEYERLEGMAHGGQRTGKSSGGVKLYTQDSTKEGGRDLQLTGAKTFFLRFSFSPSFPCDVLFLFIFSRSMLLSLSVSLSLSRSLTHAHAHTHTHALTHTHTHAQTHTHTHAHTHAHTHKHTPTRTRTRTNTHLHTRTHTGASRRPI